MNTLSIKNRTKYKFFFEKDFNKILNYFVKIMNLKNNINVDILITNNKGIKKISNIYRNINKATDVLSFPFKFNSLFLDKLKFNHLGEIVLSYEKIESQAKKFNHSVKREFCYLFAHGLVHLLGKDHKTKSEEKEFNDIVKKIMIKVKINRN